MADTILMDQNRGPAILIVGWVGFALSTAFVAARLYTRVNLSNMAGWDDGLLVFSVLLNLVGLSMTSASVSYGLGQHREHLPPGNINQVLFYAGICQPFVVASSLVPKQAVVILLVHLMGTQKHGKWFLYGLIVILYISTALCLIFMWVQCDPPSHYWNPDDTTAKCMSPNMLIYMTFFAGSFSAFVSLCLATFPITILWDLKIKMRKKVMIGCLMGLSVIAMVCGIVKTYYLPLQQKWDFSWEFFHLLLWTFIETDIVIICACIPVLPRLVLFLRHWRSSKTTPPSEMVTRTMTNNIHGTNNIPRHLPGDTSESAFTGIRSGTHISTICSSSGDPERQIKPIAKNVIFKSVEFEQHLEYS